MSGIGAVERLVAQGEVRDDVALDRRLQQRPQQPRRIAQVAALDAPSNTEAHVAEYIAAKPLDQRRAFDAARGHGTDDLAHRAAGERGERALEPADAVLDLLDAHPHA